MIQPTTPGTRKTILTGGGDRMMTPSQGPPDDRPAEGTQGLFADEPTRRPPRDAAAALTPPSGVDPGRADPTWELPPRPSGEELGSTPHPPAPGDSAERSSESPSLDEPIGLHGRPEPGQVLFGRYLVE